MLSLLKPRSFLARYHTKGVSNQVSSNLHHEIKNYSRSNSSTKMRKKRKSGEKISGLQNGAIRGLSGQVLGLQIGAKGITYRDSFRDIKSCQKDYKSGQRNFKSEQGL